MKFEQAFAGNKGLCRHGRCSRSVSYLCLVDWNPYLTETTKGLGKLVLTKNAGLWEHPRSICMCHRWKSDWGPIVDAVVH